MSALDDRNRLLDHYHGCRKCALQSGWCEEGLDLLAAVALAMAPEETMQDNRERNADGTIQQRQPVVQPGQAAAQGPQGSGDR